MYNFENLWHLLNQSILVFFVEFTLSVTSSNFACNHNTTFNALYRSYHDSSGLEESCQQVIKNLYWISANTSFSSAQQSTLKPARNGYKYVTARPMFEQPHNNSSDNRGSSVS